MICKYFLPFYEMSSPPPTLLIVSFEAQKLGFWWSRVYLFFRWLLCFGVSSEKLLPNPGSWWFTPINVFLYKFFSFNSFFFLIIFKWRIIALECCVGFYRTTTWISCKNPCIPSLLNLPPTSAHPAPLGLSFPKCMIHSELTFEHDVG